MTFSNSSSSFIPSIRRRDRSLVGRLLSAIRAQRPQRTRGSPELSDHLRRDIGLGPKVERRNHWDYR
jgi:hypothetical protein